MLTGIDRVERAYLEHLLDDPVPLWALVRTRAGYLLLDRDRAGAFLRRLDTRDWPARPDLLSRLAPRDFAEQALTETGTRALARGRAAPWRLDRMLERHLPSGTHYLNVGHSNLTPRVIRALKTTLAAHIAVMVHDTIPLDHPETQRPPKVAEFRAFLSRVAASADRVIYNAHATATAAEAHLAQMGPVPPGIVAPLGVTPTTPAPEDLPAHLPPDRPYFVTLGTIEPRKNHALLLDVWADLGPAAPALVICGSRGWRNDAVFARLDALTPGGPVIEAPGLSDGAVAALVQGAQALLFPSRAEGYGLPALEAAALGTPVICSDLPVFRELLGDWPIYATAPDQYEWQKIVAATAIIEQRRTRPGAVGTPRWDTHFKTVLGALS